MSREYNGPPYGLVEPESIPETIKNVPDLAMRQRAEEAFINSSLFPQLLQLWEYILGYLEEGLKPDIMRATILDDSLHKCLKALYRWKAAIPTLNQIPFEDLIMRVPSLPSDHTDVKWPTDADFIRDTKKRLYSTFTLIYEIREFQAQICRTPSLATDILAESKASAARGAPSSRKDVVLTETDEPQPERDTSAATYPKELDSRAVGIAHELLNAHDYINVAEAARRLGVERTRLYRACPAFMAMVGRDRASREAAKSQRPRGWKDSKTRTVEGLAEDE
jgi:hypothetical protein